VPFFDREVADVAVAAEDLDGLVGDPDGDLAGLVEPERRERLVAGLRELGFTWVTLDLEGFRSGSMNAALQEKGERP